ncbi:glutamate racemase [Aquimarina addita]|uniref:Glutamate racemase n=1 Tax=Aquimarina addita TaxID=870485 RepID=A0ABP6UL13_9FLAO
MNNQAIGIFDSGIGGTSIWQEIAIALPYENTIYLADSKYAPYGKRSADEIIKLSIRNTEKLIDFDCKIVVVACNTATTNAIKVLRERFRIPFIGIEPAIKPAALQTKTHKIGILATQGTLSSELFASTSDLYTDTTEIIEVVGTGLVELIEDGKIHTPEMLSLLTSHLQPMIKKDIDHLVLGCSHYPYLLPVLKKILPKNIQIIDSGEAVAKQTKVILSKNNLLNTNTHEGTHTFYTNKTLAILEGILKNSTTTVNINYLKY